MSGCGIYFIFHKSDTVQEHVNQQSMQFIQTCHTQQTEMVSHVTQRFNSDTKENTMQQVFTPWQDSLVKYTVH